MAGKIFISIIILLVAVIAALTYLVHVPVVRTVEIGPCTAEYETTIIPRLSCLFILSPGCGVGKVMEHNARSGLADCLCKDYLEQSHKATALHLTALCKETEPCMTLAKSCTDGSCDTAGAHDISVSYGFENDVDFLCYNRQKLFGKIAII